MLLVFLWLELGYRYSWYRLEYSVVFWLLLVLLMLKWVRCVFYVFCVWLVMFFSVLVVEIFSVRL